MLYQIISLYKDRGRAGLVTSYGEYVGLYPIKDISLVSENPLFRKEDYKIGSTVVWVDAEDVYEGVIQSLSDSTALVVDVKKLLPVNHVVRVPYWKIPEGRNAVEST